MGELTSAKTIGGVGALLMLIGGILSVIPLIAIIGWVLPIVGFIMVAIAVKNISDLVNDKAIFSNFIVFIIMNIIAIIALVAILAIAIGGFALTSIGDFTNPQSFTSDLNLGGFLALCIVGFIVYYILYILAAVFLKKSFDGIGTYTKVDLFKTTGLIYLIGAILVIIGIGFFIIFIAQIIMIIAFFSLPDAPPPLTSPPQQTYQSQQVTQPQPPPQQTPGRICPDCGRPIPNDARVCPYCGKKFEGV
jgi:uncharacterized membrane protein